MVGETGTDYFGHSVAISSDGDLVAGGSWWGSSNGTSSGTVKVFSSPSFTGILDNTTEVELTLYPNPTQDILHISTSQSIQQIEVYSLTGELISRTTDTNIRSLDLSSFNSGIYFVTFTFEGTAVTKKVIKK